MSTHNIGFYENLTKIVLVVSSNIIKYAPYFFCCLVSFKTYYSLSFCSQLEVNLSRQQNSDQTGWLPKLRSDFEDAKADLCLPRGTKAIVMVL